MVTKAEAERPKAKPPNFEIFLKVSSTDKLQPDRFIEYVKMAFDCETTSPLMYSQEKDQFFMYVTVTKREA
jgi:hypothetical protein